jgi:threonyl-tRNA synthetase
MLDPFETVEVHMLRQIRAERNKDMQLALKPMHRPLGVRVVAHLDHSYRDALEDEDLVS